MSELYNGDGTIPDPSVGATNSITILSTTNTAPIVVTLTTFIPMNMQTGDLVEIEGSDHADGLWTIKLVGASSFSLDGSSAPGSIGGENGVANNYSVTPQIQILQDLVDPVSASSINPALESLANLSPFNYRNAGKFRLHNLAYSAINTIGNRYVHQFIPSTGYPGTWYDVNDGVRSMAQLLPFTIPYVKIGDVLEMNFSTSIQAVIPPSLEVLGIALAYSSGGGTNTLLPNSAQLLFAGSYGTTTPFGQGVSLSTPILCGFSPMSTAQKSVNIGLQVFAASADTIEFDVEWAWALTVRHWRPN